MMIHSWEALEPIQFKAAGVITAAFTAISCFDLQSAAHYLQQLPYGRIADRDDPLAVMREGRGTCSTKHALLYRLGCEQGIAISLMVGIFVMSERNTPSVGEVLERYGLTSIPEAHCYVRVGAVQVDITRQAIELEETITEFLYEEEIEPGQIGDYKIALHRRFLNAWLEQEANSISYSLEELWRIREECIAALST